MSKEVVYELTLCCLCGGYFSTASLEGITMRQGLLVVFMVL